MTFAPEYLKIAGELMSPRIMLWKFDNTISLMQSFLAGKSDQKFLNIYHSLLKNSHLGRKTLSAIYAHRSHVLLQEILPQQLSFNPSF